MQALTPGGEGPASIFSLQLLDRQVAGVPDGAMQAHTRALIAAATFAFVTQKKVAGLYDHTQGRDLRVAAESRGDQVQGVDAERGGKFGGTLPEILDAKTAIYISMERDGEHGFKGYDRASKTFFTARVEGGVVQVFDHTAETWHAFDVQDAAAAQSYHRAAT